MNKKIIIGIISIIVIVLIAIIVVLFTKYSDNVKPNDTINNTVGNAVDNTINNTIDNNINNTIENEEIYDENLQIVETINNNSNLPLTYLSKYDETNATLQNYEKLINFMSIDFHNDDVEFSYYGYPNDESEKYLGSFSLLTNKYNILGITIGDDIEQAVTKFQEYGFKLDPDSSYYISLTYGDFIIDISEDFENEKENHIIGTIKLYAESEYLGNNIY